MSRNKRLLEIRSLRIAGQSGESWNEIVKGIDLDSQTRCAHWHSALDIIAIKMKCCGEYYACKDCHDVLADHSIAVWPCEEWNHQAVLCGACGVEMSIADYLRSENRCPYCMAQFNPGCRNHYNFYFEWSE